MIMAPENESASLICPSTGDTRTFHGDADSVDIPGTEIAEFLLKNRAPWVLSHKHNGPGFSEADADSTVTCAILGKILGFPLLDHVVLDMRTGKIERAAETRPELLNPEVSINEHLRL